MDVLGRWISRNRSDSFHRKPSGCEVDRNDEAAYRGFYKQKQDGYDIVSRDSNFHTKQASGSTSHAAARRNTRYILHPLQFYHSLYNNLPECS